MYTCRECENEINQATELCPHCGADLTAPIVGAEAPKAKPSLGKIILRWGVLLGVLLAAIWSFLWFVVPERQGDPTAQAEARAAESLREVRAALVDFASAQGGVYPRQFEAERQLPNSVHPWPGWCGRTDPYLCASGSRRKLWLPEFLSG
jgi:hypothetical protein